MTDITLQDLLDIIAEIREGLDKLEEKIDQANEDHQLLLFPVED